MIVCNEVCLKGFTHWVPMGFRLDSNSNGVLILIFCYGFLFFGFGWLDFGFQQVGLWDSDGVWVGFGLVGLGWRGGHGGGVGVTVVGRVWLSWVIVVGLFCLHWLLWQVYLVVVGPGGVCSCYVLLCSLCWFDLK